MGNNEKGFSKKTIMKIVIPVLIIIGLVAVWLIKNPKVSENNSGLSANNSQDSNPDFILLNTEELDLKQLKSYGVPIIIDFGADSCIPCKEMAPVLVKLNEELRGKAIVKFVDVWKYQDLAQGYPVSVIPTQFFFDKEGNPYVPTQDNPYGVIMYSSKETNEHIFTTHEGGITEDILMEILSEMGMGK